MSRNASGTYTLPSGNPVVSGTLIEASWANTTLSDLATAMTDSLSRSGQGGMTAALRLFDGTSSVPGLAWGSETTTGWYRAGAGDMRLVVTGSEVMKYLSTGITVTGTFGVSGAATLSSTLAVTGATTIQGLTVGKGAGAVSTNTAVGASALASNTTGSLNTAVGYTALTANTTGYWNTAVGRTALSSNTTGYDNTAVGVSALTGNTTGTDNSALGLFSLQQNTTGSANTAVGVGALSANTTASNNTAVGYQAGYSNTTGNIDAFGYGALYSNTTGQYSVAIGTNALYSNSTGNYNVAVGRGAASNNTGSYNTAIGYATVNGSGGGSYNVALGVQALSSNTTASNNTAVGYQAGYTNQTGSANIFIGRTAGLNATTNYNVYVGFASGPNNASSTGQYNTAIGSYAGTNLTSGSYNTFVGCLDSTGSYASGGAITTGSKNSILGNYNGNQGGLDIRTSSNNIVLSDGDGNPAAYCAGTAATWTFGIGGTSNGGTGSITLNSASGTGYGPIIEGQANGSRTWLVASYNKINGGTATYLNCTNSAGYGVYLNGATATSWTAVSDENRKVIIEPITDAANKVSTLRTVIGRLKTDAEDVRRPYLIAQDVQAILPEAVSSLEDKEGPLLGLAYTEVIPLLVAAIKELKSELDSVKAELATLKGT